MPSAEPNRPWRSWYGTAEWKRRRHEILTAQPVCRFCKTARSTIADHIKPHRGDPDLFWNGKLQGLCKPCHDSAKQSRERRHRAAVGADGWPIA